MTASSADRQAKRHRVLEVLDAQGGEALLLTSHGAVTWYLDGARSHVSLMGDPVAAVLVRPQGDQLFVFENEADRLIAEELHPDDAALVTRVPWHEPLVPGSRAASHAGVHAAPASAGAGISAGSESGSSRTRGLLREADVASGLRAARASLLPAELERYRRLSSDVAETLTDAALAAAPAGSERDTAAQLAGSLVARGIDPLVVLVAGSSRLAHRHPLPTTAPLGSRAMLVVCGRRHGLIANATRWVQFSHDTPDAPGDGRRILAVEATFLDATRPGARLGGVFAAGVAAYADNGFDPEEWRRHHQGGATGYVGRDPRGTPDVDDLVQENHAFAWNPSAPGVKVEDTVLATSAGIEVLTRDERWPVVVVAGRPRPLPLRR